MKQLLKRIIHSVGPRLAANRTARDLFFLAAEQFTPAIRTKTGSYHYYVSTADRTVGREVYLSGGFDTDCIHHIFRLLCELGIADFSGKLFVDIGANIGTTSVPVIIERGFLGGIAIEPEPSNFALLQANAITNGLQDRLKCLRFALSDSIGHGEMELCPVNLGDHRLRPRNHSATDGIYHEASRDVVSVKTTTFDELVRNGTVDPASVGLVWIDTQGHEANVLQGAQTLLRSRLPVVMEYWPYALNRAGGLDLLECLLKTNYKSFVDARACKSITTGAIQPIDQLPSLRSRYAGPNLTDLILLK